MIKLEEIIRAKQAEIQLAKAPQIAGHSWGVRQLPISLLPGSNSDRVIYWQTVNGVAGSKLYYQRAGSVPGGKLHLKLGGELLDIVPGTKIAIPFTSFAYKIGLDSCHRGNAQLLIFANPLDDVSESDSIRPGAPIRLACFDQTTHAITVTENTQPAFASLTDSWDVTGWKRLRVEIDGGATNTVTSCTIIPWMTFGSSLTTSTHPLQIYENGLGRIDLPDSLGTAYRYRTFELELVPMANPIEDGAAVGLAFEVRDLLPSAATEITFNVFGVE